MDVWDMVVAGITAWVLASGPVALLIGRILRKRGEQYPVPEGAYDVVERRELVGSSR